MKVIHKRNLHRFDPGVYEFHELTDDQLLRFGFVRGISYNFSKFPVFITRGYSTTVKSVWWNLWLSNYNKHPSSDRIEVYYSLVVNDKRPECVIPIIRFTFIDRANLDMSLPVGSNIVIRTLK